MDKSFARVLLGTLIGLALGACVPKSDLDTAQSENLARADHLAAPQAHNAQALVAFLSWNPYR